MAEFQRAPLAYTRYITASVAVIDTWAAAASDYHCAVPRRDAFAVHAPHREAPGSGSDAADAEEEAAGVAGPTPAQASGEQERRRRKRKRPAYTPNEPEREAIARHEGVAPLLQQAVIAMRDWMSAQEATTLHAALGAAPMPSADSPAAAATTTRQGAVAVSEADATTDPPNYALLCEMASSVRPKFRWHNAAAASAEQSLCGRAIRNDGDSERWGDAYGHAVLIPAHSSFLMSSAAQLPKLVERAAGFVPAGGFQLLLLDPPWENKSVHRGAAALYATLSARHLLGLPLRQLAAPASCLVALWVTHRQKLRRFVEEELLPAWGLEVSARWHWLKVKDAGGAPLSPLDVAHRRPYETLLLCCPTGVPFPWEQPRSGFTQPPDGLVLVAPPAQHSRKPIVDELLRSLVPPGAACLEMFSRRVAGGWTCWGNECLRFQGQEHFEAGCAESMPSRP